MMKRIAAILTAALSVATAQPAPAIDLGFGLFKKKPAGPTATPKADSSLKVKQLIATLQSDPDTDRRKVAAEALRTIDTRNNGEVIPTLINTLQNDPNPGVRAIAAESLGAIKSVYPTAGAALESAEKSDPDTNVRTVAKASLWQYHLNGYKTATASTAGLPAQTGEPPIATPRKPFVPTTPPPSNTSTTEVSFRPITQGMGKGAVYQPTAEPPIAKPRVPVLSVPDIKPPLPTLETPSIPVPMTMPAPTAPAPSPLPNTVPPITIPDVPMIPIGPATPTVIPPPKK